MSIRKKENSPVIKCESLYKVFGDYKSNQVPKLVGNVDASEFQNAGCIVGVNNASFEVFKGDLLVIMGLSGSGKSTLLRCISRLTEATAGKRNGPVLENISDTKPQRSRPLGKRFGGP